MNGTIIGSCAQTPHKIGAKKMLETLVDTKKHMYVKVEIVILVKFVSILHVFVSNTIHIYNIYIYNICF